MDHPFADADGDLDPRLAVLLRRVYGVRGRLDAAARHLWMIYRAAPAGPPRSARTRPRRAAAVLLAATIVMLPAMSGLAAASSVDSLPGDLLYPVKRGMERVDLWLPRSDDAEARAHLRVAQRRLLEARRAAAVRPAVLDELIDAAMVAVAHAESVGGAAFQTAVASVRAHADREVARLAPHLAPAVDPRAVAAADAGSAGPPEGPGAPRALGALGLVDAPGPFDVFPETATARAATASDEPEEPGGGEAAASAGPGGDASGSDAVGSGGDGSGGSGGSGGDGSGGSGGSGGGGSAGSGGDGSGGSGGGGSGGSGGGGSDGSGGGGSDGSGGDEPSGSGPADSVRVRSDRAWRTQHGPATFQDADDHRSS